MGDTGFSSPAASLGGDFTSGADATGAASKAALAAKEEGAGATCADTFPLPLSPSGKAERNKRPKDLSGGVTAKA
jgi:hypothetical protein